MTEIGPSAAAELAPELIQFLVELNNALHKHTMYPPGHPLLLTASDQLTAQLTQIFQHRSTLALGISPNQIMAAGGASDPRHPVIRELAARLHRLNVGAIKLSQGASRDELDGLLRALVSWERGGAALTGQSWPHIRLHPLSYSQLALVGEPGSVPGGGSWATRVWHELSRVALEQEIPEEGIADPAQVARAIDAHQWNDIFGRRVADSVIDLLDACRTRGGAEALVLQSRISQVITSMAPETLERLVTLERPQAERRRFLLEIAQSMAVDAVLDLVQAAAATSGRSLSPALLQLLAKLAEHSELGMPETRERAEFAFRHQVRQLIEGWEEWDRRDPAPIDHQRTLEHLRLAGKSPLRGNSATYECEPERILMLSLEVGVASASTCAAAAFLIHQGRTAQLRELFNRSPHPALVTDILRNVASETVLRGLLQGEPLDMTALEIIIPLLGDDALAPLLEALVKAESPERRDQLVRLLLPFGDAAGTEAWTRMERSSWPAQRNLLTLLTRLPSLPGSFSPGIFIEHPEPRVRTEGLRILFRGSATRSRAICEALAASDPAVIRMSVFAAVEDCPPAAVPLLIPLIERTDVESGVRSSAVAAVAAVAQPLVVDALLGVCFVGGRWFRRPRVAGKSPVVLAALAGLARHWSNHARARAVLGLAAGHPDEEIRAAAERRPR